MSASPDLFRVTFTDRRGGVSGPPYDTFNLSPAVGDDVAAVAANQRALAAQLSVDHASLYFMGQVHGADVAVVPGPSREPATEPITGLCPVVSGVDALVTNVAGVGLVAMAADCVPVVLADRESGVIGVAHAGRRGVELGVVGAAIAAMRGLGAAAENIEVWLGPAVCGECYEVPKELQDEVAAVVPGVRSITRWATPGLELRIGLVNQLHALGVASVSVDARCTMEDPDLFSHRGDAGRSGRQAGAVALLP